MIPNTLFVTGRLAEPALRRVLSQLPAEYAVKSQLAVLGISVAALMHADWIQRKLTLPARIERVVLPGYCQGSLATLQSHFQVPFELGPKDLLDIPEFLSGRVRVVPDLSQYDIEILAEINHAPRLSETQLLEQAELFQNSGADFIDLGCIPGETWTDIAAAVRLLRDHGLRVSVDSFNRAEVEPAVQAGAELVLSCNASNRDWLTQLAADTGCALVVIPDDLRRLETMDDTVAMLEKRGVRFRLDPVLEPIGYGFSDSLQRYFETRKRYPHVEMMMGVGNLTELTEVDSGGVNMLLAAICQELRIFSILTTEVAAWCQSAVREFDIARRMSHHAVTENVLPKHLAAGLVQLRSKKRRRLSERELQEFAAALKDPNFRIFAEHGQLHVMNRDQYITGRDPYELFDQLAVNDPSHAFYLGYEFAKAMTAITLGKHYQQDEALDWGWQTIPEISALHRRKQPGTEPPPPAADDEVAGQMTGANEVDNQAKPPAS